MVSEFVSVERDGGCSCSFRFRQSSKRLHLLQNSKSHLYFNRYIPIYSLNLFHLYAAKQLWIENPDPGVGKNTYHLHTDDDQGHSVNTINGRYMKLFERKIEITSASIPSSVLRRCIRLFERTIEIFRSSRYHTLNRPTKGASV
jgi:hypothetical protein